MSIITIATSKGGVGKTTIAQVIVGSCVRRGFLRDLEKLGVIPSNNMKIAS